MSDSNDISSDILVKSKKRKRKGSAKKIPSVCFVDTEFNAIDYTGQNHGIQEVIEIAAVIFQNGEPVDRFQRYCKLTDGHVITKRSKSFNGITEDILNEKGIPFKDAMAEFILFLNKYDIKKIFAFGTSDKVELKRTAKLNECGKETKRMINKIADVYPKFCGKFNITEAFSLKEICEVCHIEHGSRAHSALYDAEDTGLSYYNMKRKNFDLEKIEQIRIKKKKPKNPQSSPELSTAQEEISETKKQSGKRDEKNKLILKICQKGGKIKNAHKRHD